MIFKKALCLSSPSFFVYTRFNRHCLIINYVATTALRFPTRKYTLTAPKGSKDLFIKIVFVQLTYSIYPNNNASYNQSSSWNQ